ncbi:uncharacterized protein [Salminus brasiliensis]|uniref:uncharacterized protein isoform X3 n=1 Tax=Salminus brasiliensis TaxID=930266 RepID=UPI003B83395E
MCYPASEAWDLYVTTSPSYGVAPTEQLYPTRQQWRQSSTNRFLWRQTSWRTTPPPFWRKPYYFRPTSPFYRYVPTPPPFWRKPYYFRPTPPTYRVTKAPHWREPFYPRPYIPDPRVEVYQQVENRENVIVVCQFGTKTSMSSFHLSVRNGDSSYMLPDPACTAETTCVFNVTVTPPASFTCVHVVNIYRNLQTLLSGVYTYQPHKGSEQLDLVASPSYIGFASFIGLGLIILVTVVVVTTLKTRHKGSRREAQENVYAVTKIL